MDRVWKSGAAVGAPALDNASVGFATAGNPGIGTPATKPGPHWFHMVTEEILSVITAAGISFDKTNVAQLLAAINILSAQQGAIIPGGRLTLSTGTPVTTTNVIGVGNVLYTPYITDRIQLYNGTNWATFQFTELSQSLTDTTKSPAASVANSIYDVFVWSDSGTMRATRGPLWTSLTARGTGAGTTELELFQGRLVNKVAITNGPAARRGHYVGTIGTDSGNIINDADNQRLCWNNYNRVVKPLKRLTATASWTGSAGVIRQANADTNNQVIVLTGLNEDAVYLNLLANYNTNGGAAALGVSIGLDSTSVPSSSIFGGNSATQIGTAAFTATFNNYVGLGRHTLVWLEGTSNSIVNLWVGVLGGTVPLQSGLVGFCKT